MFCPKCGTENPAEGRYCRSCGAALPGDAVAGEEKPFSFDKWVSCKVASLFSGRTKGSGSKSGNWNSALGTLFTGVAFSAVSAALAFQPWAWTWWYWMLIPAFAMMGSGIAQTIKLWGDKEARRRQKGDTWEGSIGSLFMGIAFTAVSIVLAFQPAGFGWWFWMLIPGFAMLGSASAQLIRIVSGDQPEVAFGTSRDDPSLAGGQRQALPPNKTVFAADEARTKYETGEMVPPSVTEETTRQLKLEKEGETTKLPSEG